MKDERHEAPVQDRPGELVDKLEDIKESDTPKSGGDAAPPFNDRDAELQGAEDEA